jgi:pimeloyl-ACP methyl ester carboxylesterase
MDAYPYRVAIVGGLGCSGQYLRALETALLRIAPDVSVSLFPLQHGLSLDEEADWITHRLGRGSAGVSLVGFSTGCAVVMRMARLNPGLARRTVLVAPAELHTRLDAPTRDWLLQGSPGTTPTHDASWLAIWRGLGRRSWLWWRVVGWYWVLTGLRALGTPAAWLARAYDLFIGRAAGDPDPTELARCFFAVPPSDLRRTVASCLVGADLTRWVREAPHPVHVLVGRLDPYLPYSTFLAAATPHVRLHLAEGNHHLLYNQPGAAARRLAAILRL